jgi:hypothetical protein
MQKLFRVCHFLFCPLAFAPLFMQIENDEMDHKSTNCQKQLTRQKTFPYHHPLKKVDCGAEIRKTRLTR